MTTLSWNGNGSERTLGLWITRGLGATWEPSIDLAQQVARTTAPRPDARSGQRVSVRPAGRPLGRSLIAFLVYAALLLAWHELRTSRPQAVQAQAASASAERTR